VSENFAVDSATNRALTSITEDDFLIVLTPSEMEYLRTSLRNESARLKAQGFTGLQKYVDNLRDKVSNMMIEQAHDRFDSKAKV
jgi:hypothetical protein